SYLCKSGAGLWLFRFELLNYRTHGRCLGSIRRESQIIFVSHNCFFPIATFFVRRSEQLVNDWFSVRELIDRDLKFARGEIILPFFFLSAAEPDVRFGLKTVALANRTIEAANRLVSLTRLAINAAFNRGSLGIDRTVTSRCFYFGERAIRIVQV